jgi:hypothetical protein
MGSTLLAQGGMLLRQQLSIVRKQSRTVAVPYLLLLGPMRADGRTKVPGNASPA